MTTAVTCLNHVRAYNDKVRLTDRWKEEGEEIIVVLCRGDFVVTENFRDYLGSAVNHTDGVVSCARCASGPRAVLKSRDPCNKWSSREVYIPLR